MVSALRYALGLACAGLVSSAGASAHAQSPLVQDFTATVTAEVAATPTATATSTATATPTAQAPMGEPRCIVTGRVLNIKRGDGVTANGKAVSVPVAELEVESSVPQDARYTGPFCQQLTGQALPGTMPIVHFRLCDPTSEFYTSDRVKGVAGRNLGGGYYCIEQVTPTLK
jgi:hypothetical protein